MEFKYTIEYPTKVTAIGKTINGLYFTGIARCAPDDKFDVKKGKKIARLKAEIKQLANIRKCANTNMEASLNLLDQQSRRVEKIKAQELKKIHELEEQK